MHVRHARGNLRLGLLSLLLVGLLGGCGGPSTATGPVSSANPKTGERRKEQADFMKDQKPAAPKK